MHGVCRSWGELWGVIEAHCALREVVVDGDAWRVFFGDRWIAFNPVDLPEAIRETVKTFGTAKYRSAIPGGYLYIVKHSPSKRLAIFFHDDAVEMFGEEFVEGA
jgi:hypothetical protein